MNKLSRLDWNKTLIILFAALLTLIALFTALSVSAHSGATGIVKDRMDRFKESKGSMKLIRKSIKQDDFSTIANEATQLANWSSEMIRYFPEGSNKPPSEALPEIWENFDRFKSLNANFTEASNNLLQAALEQNKEATFDRFGDLAKSCDACHDDFRE